MNLEQTIDEIIALEWRAFDKVHNEGGRASCQDNFETFALMRKSQFLCWDGWCLQAWQDDLVQAERVGRNLIQEKYARMMASTAPDEFARFAHTLPRLSDLQRSTIEAIILVQLDWREDVARRYPAMSGQARRIHTRDDTLQETSFETYLRGELGTYSPRTLATYQQMVEDWLLRGDNLSEAAMAHTALLYGYASLQDAERSLGRLSVPRAAPLSA